MYMRIMYQMLKNSKALVENQVLKKIIQSAEGKYRFREEILGPDI